MFFEVRKPRQFTYKPHFYDPDKEELEQLKAKYGPIGETYKRKIDFRAAMNEKKEKKIDKPFPISKILLFACAIVAILYFLILIVEKWQ